MRVLLVEDDAPLRRVLQEALEADGVLVDAAENGEVALALAAAKAPDVVVLDSRMPVMDGVHFARTYRGTAARTAPLIAMSASGDVALFAALVGAASYMVKPFRAEELLAAVRKVAGARKGA